jgi:hypothetical protein
MPAMAAVGRCGAPMMGALEEPLRNAVGSPGRGRKSASTPRFSTADRVLGTIVAPPDIAAYLHRAHRGSSACAGCGDGAA